MHASSTRAPGLTVCETTSILAFKLFAFSAFRLACLFRMTFRTTLENNKLTTSRRRNDFERKKKAQTQCESDGFVRLELEISRVFVDEIGVPATARRTLVSANMSVRERSK